MNVSEGTCDGTHQAADTPFKIHLDRAGLFVPIQSFHRADFPARGIVALQAQIHRILSL